MTKGIQVTWPGERGNPNNPEEIEYLYGIDVDRIDQIPLLTETRSVWNGRPFKYAVDTRIERPGPGEAHLIVHYDPTNPENEEIAREWPGDEYWGKNTIILKQGEQNGICRWRHQGAADDFEVPWKAFDLDANRAPPSEKYLRSQRAAEFRSMICACDDSRCVLTCETTIQALDAAHLIPAAEGQNDTPFNGIVLRADLHRLFDACLFTFGPDGRVAFPAGRPGLSADYRELLLDRRLPPTTLQRVGGTIASPLFQNRCR